ncbi:hypothetical protein [Ensifer adhaerens]|uniref:hypothetical protein n=1 Tax=Ensifer adhaerens TaxID=106592 RepID=UPI000CF04EF8|nr:hypothetical protein [Ensifer adhaerens]
MTEITNHRAYTFNGQRVSAFELVREGEVIATVMKSNKPFSPWNVHTAAGRQQFPNKDAAMSYCSML